MKHPKPTTLSCRFGLLALMVFAACSPGPSDAADPSDSASSSDSDPASDPFITDQAGDNFTDGDALTPGDSAGGDPFKDTGLDPEPLLPGPFHILFDVSHAETAGNADWKIDDNFPNPQPVEPSSAESWKGAISSWAFALWQTGRYVVKSLPENGSITFNVASNNLDLSNFDAFIVPEPNAPFSSDEKIAILDFVFAGGGLFMIANHGGSDRDNDTWDSSEIWRDLMNNNTQATNPFGIQFVGNSFTESPVTNLADLPDNRALHGPFGEVLGVGIHGGTSLSITGGHPTVRGLIWRNGYAQGTSYVDVATSKYGAGRVAAIGDSSPADDGSGQSGDELFDGWNEALVTNDILFLNLTAWLVRDAGE